MSQPRFRPAVLVLSMLAGMAILSPGQAAADSFEKVSDKAAFLSHVRGRTLRISLFDITITVKPDGSIRGSAMGWDLTGTWAWNDGLFCREMDWSGALIPRNCQLVEVSAGQSIRFTVDGGRGRSATFQIN